MKGHLRDLLIAGLIFRSSPLLYPQALNPTYLSQMPAPARPPSRLPELTWAGRQRVGSTGGIGGRDRSRIRSGLRILFRNCGRTSARKSSSATPRSSKVSRMRRRVCSVRIWPLLRASAINSASGLERSSTLDKSFLMMMIETCSPRLHFSNNLLCLVDDQAACAPLRRLKWRCSGVREPSERNL